MSEVLRHSQLSLPYKLLLIVLHVSIVAGVTPGPRTYVLLPREIIIVMLVRAADAEGDGHGRGHW